jgi:hypothetical protein
MLLVIISLTISIIAYLLNVRFLSAHPNISPKTATFFEAILATLWGFLMLLGSGGISRNSRSAAIMASAVKAISDRDIIGPSEILRRDRWKPKGFVRVGLVLVMTGIFLLIIHFASSYTNR